MRQILLCCLLVAVGILLWRWDSGGDAGTILLTAGLIGIVAGPILWAVYRILRFAAGL